MKHFLFLSVALSALFWGNPPRDGNGDGERGVLVRIIDNFTGGSQSSEPAFLGIQSTTISGDKARKLGFENAYGSYVTKVLPGTAAEAAGVQPFDYIYGIDALRTGEKQSLTAILRRFEPGDRVELYLVRDSRRLTLPATLGRRSDVEPEGGDECDEPFFGVRQDHGYRPERGVGITVVPNSTAEAMGLQQGDVITAINGHPIIDWQDLSTAIDHTKVGQSLTVEYRRDGRQRQGSRPIGSRCDIAEDADYNFDDALYGDRRRKLSDVKVSLQDPGSEELRTLQARYGIDLSGANPLRIEELNLIPDASTGLFRLQFNLPQRGPTRIRLFNETGRQIYHYDLDSFSGAFSDEVDIAQNGIGSYFLEVRQNNRSAVRKIILRND